MIPSFNFFSQFRDGLAAASVGNYALFAGGRDPKYPDLEANNSVFFSIVDMYEISTGRMTSFDIEPRENMGSGVVGPLIFFVGGNFGSAISNTADFYHTVQGIV
jgi:hypothetical protein